MAEFLKTTATNYRLEDLVKTAQQYLVLISPYIKVNVRLRELLAERARRGLDIRIIYGKKHQPQEIDWLQEFGSVQIKYRPNLHAKCYLNEQHCIITSLNLYDFSQVNNDEMGVLISLEKDNDLFMAAFNEAKRLSRVGLPVSVATAASQETVAGKKSTAPFADGKLSTSKIARKLGLTNVAFEAYLVETGYLAGPQGEYVLTQLGKEIGGERRKGPRFGIYFLWPEDAFEKSG